MKKKMMKRYPKQNMKDKCCSKGPCCGGGIYFIGMIGAAVYYIQQSNSFWQGVLGILKSLVWPAFLVYKLLG
ncbi:hypothetical protein M0R19_06625 [Candidatus Pacearchaeota archaeon]|nr:hypothetical protein [Candidatus Pacearchaeota archaeon]